MQTVQNREYFTVPSNCPVCGTGLVRDGEYLQCPNEDCTALLTGNIEKWIRNLEVDDFGPKLILALHQKGLVKDVADLYKLKVEQIAGLERMGMKSAQKVLDNLHAKKEVPLATFLGSLNVQGCDVKKFKMLIEEGHNTLDKIQKLKIPEMSKIHGMGTKTATNLFNGLRKRESLINRLQKHVKVVEVKKITGPLSGLSFCFTGEMSKPRGELEGLAVAAGAELKGVSKGLSYLVTADANSTSTKAQKARKLGTKTLSEKDFLKMVGQ